MATFITTFKIDGKPVTFNRKAKVAKSQFLKGWVIQANEETGTFYNGNYVRNVGWLDDLGNDGKLPFHLKRDAEAALANAVNLGILHKD